MMLWSILALVALVVAALLAVPLLRRRGDAGARAAYDLAVYRDQLRDLEDDVARAVMSEAEAGRARAEIERRMLRAAAEADGAPRGGSDRRVAWLTLAAVTLALPIGAFLLYDMLGKPALPGAPLARRDQGADSTAQAQATPDREQIDDLVARLAARMQENPQDFQGWMLLARSYLTLGRHAEAADAFRNAAALEEGQARADVHAGLATALIGRANGIVTPAARAALERALRIEPDDPAARYYIALADAQAGDLQAAFDGWLALARDSEPDAPWMNALRAQLAWAADELGIDLAEVWSPRAAAPEADADQQAMIRGMVEGLAARLAEAPDDFDGWMRLGRSYRVLGEPERSADAYARAVALRPEDAAALAGYGGALVGRAGDGPVPSDARQVLNRLLALDANNPTALWFLGLADAQDGRPADAARKWQRLLEQLPPGSQERALLTRRIEDLGEVE